MTSVSARGGHVAFEEFLAAALAQITPLAAVEVPLEWAGGRFTAAPVLAALPAPAFTNSAMDGFALSTADLPGSGEAVLPVSGDIAAGTHGEWVPGTAVRIMTGAPVPEGVDTVVPVEFTDHPNTRADLPATVRVPGDWPANKNVRIRGADVAEGEELLPAGTRLDGAGLAALAGVGVGRLRVWPEVSVGLIITGDEVVTRDPKPGQILDSNSLLIAQAVESFGGRVTHGRTSSDDDAEFDAVVSDLLPDVDLLLTTGGASVGAHDVARHVLTARGVKFSAVGIQPAKPQGFGVIDGVPVCALPGNPGAVHVSMHAIVRPILAELGHLPIPPPVEMVVTQGWSAREGMRQFVPVRIETGLGGIKQVAPVIGGGVASHRVRSLALAEGLAVVAPEITTIQPGDTLPVIRTRYPIGRA